MTNIALPIQGERLQMSIENIPDEAFRSPEDRRWETVMKKTFAYHKPSKDGLALITQLREMFSLTLDMIETLCPASREQSIAITELETAAMWAIKAVVCNDPESEVAK
jgi:hypothetical protein